MESNHKLVRTDTFTSRGNYLRVTGRGGFEQSTDIWISRVVPIEVKAIIEDSEEPGFSLRNTVYTDDYRYTIANLRHRQTLGTSPHTGKYGNPRGKGCRFPHEPRLGVSDKACRKSPYFGHCPILQGSYRPRRDGYKRCNRNPRQD